MNDNNAKRIKLDTIKCDEDDILIASKLTDVTQGKITHFIYNNSIETIVCHML